MGFDMRTAWLLLLWFLACGASGAVPAISQDVRSEAVPSEAAGERIVRLDLLAQESRPLASVIRDPFRPVITVRPARAGVRNPVRKENQAGLSGSPAFKLDMTYVGFVRGSSDLVGLVVVSGVTYSVARGDEIVPGYRVIRLTEELVEVEGPGAARKTFKRQGDRS